LLDLFLLGIRFKNAMQTSLIIFCYVSDAFRNMAKIRSKSKHDGLTIWRLQRGLVTGFNVGAIAQKFG